MDPKEIKIKFAPGAFEHFEGTQEELDGLLAEIQQLIESGEIFEKSTPLDIDQLAEEDPEFAAMIIEALEADEAIDSEEPVKNKKLH
jgi:hypothetical protein